jgi:hypothetical protein
MPAIQRINGLSRASTRRSVSSCTNDMNHTPASRKADCGKRLTRDDLLHLANLVLPRLPDLLGEADGVYVLAIGDLGVGDLD